MRTRPDQITGRDTDPYLEYAVPLSWTQYAKTDATKGEFAVEKDGTETDATQEYADPVAAEAAETTVKAEPVSDIAKTNEELQRLGGQFAKTEKELQRLVESPEVFLRLFQNLSLIHI